MQRGVGQLGERRRTRLPPAPEAATNSAILRAPAVADARGPTTSSAYLAALGVWTAARRASAEPKRSRSSSYARG